MVLSLSFLADSWKRIYFTIIKAKYQLDKEELLSYNKNVNQRRLSRLVTDEPPEESWLRQ